MQEIIQLYAKAIKQNRLTLEKVEADLRTMNPIDSTTDRSVSNE